MTAENILATKFNIYLDGDRTAKDYEGEQEKEHPDVEYIDIPVEPVSDEELAQYL